MSIKKTQLLKMSTRVKKKNWLSIQNLYLNKFSNKKAYAQKDAKCIDETLQSTQEKKLIHGKAKRDLISCNYFYFALHHPIRVCF